MLLRIFTGRSFISLVYELGWAEQFKWRSQRKTFEQFGFEPQMLLPLCSPRIGFEQGHAFDHIFLTRLLSHLPRASGSTRADGVFNGVLMG